MKKLKYGIVIGLVGGAAYLALGIYGLLEEAKEAEFKQPSDSQS